jgi:hypothetical protein
VLWSRTQKLRRIVILFNKLFSLFQRKAKQDNLSELSIVNKKDFCGEKFNIIPENWCVYSLGQELLGCLWICELINFIDKNSKEECLYVSSDEFLYPIDAIKDAVNQIKKLEN